LDNLNWVAGSHNAKFGVEVRMLRLYTDMLGGTTYSFANINDFLANKALQIQYVDDLSAPSPFNGGATGQRLAKTAFYIGYAQDEWKLRPNFTLNYGLRYEYYSPTHEARNLDVVFDINKGVLLPPDSQWYQSSASNFGPRVGFSWSPRPSGKGFLGGGHTVVRAGFGINYGPGQIEDQIQPLQSDRIQLTQSGGSYPVDANALRANFINNPNNRQYQPRAYAPEYQVPERIYQYSFSIQQELPYGMTFTAAYVEARAQPLPAQLVQQDHRRADQRGS
jgi:outer membrane receptor protein involved in Fe transport